MSRQFEELRKRNVVVDELTELLMERRILRDLYEDLDLVHTAVPDANLGAYLDDIMAAGVYISSQIRGKIQRILLTGDARISNEEG